MICSVGVDGCRAGWFYCQKAGGELSFGIAPSMEALAAVLPPKARIFIDIPIGLLEEGGQGRLCDREARRLLGPLRASSVFPAPCRPVLEAKTYQEALTISRQATGKGLSKQAYFITPKILEVDNFLQRCADGLELREVHPELCFWALNERQAMTHRKKDKAGFEERLALLSRYIPAARQLVDKALQQYLRKHLARDDILDALVALVVAAAPEAALQRIPEPPEYDAMGLPMEMVYTCSP